MLAARLKRNSSYRKPRFVRLKCFTILLSPAELQSLVELKHSSPPSLLGMPPPGDGSGLVVRALLPGAAKVEIHPAPEKGKPKFELKRIPKTDVFEGVTKAAKNVYTCHLVIRIEMMPLAMVTVP